MTRFLAISVSGSEMSGGILQTSILQKILAEKRIEVVQAAASIPLSKLKVEASKLPSTLGFAKALRCAKQPTIIAEVKRASPSKGVIRADLDPVLTAEQYVSSGATALSVLTDEKFFQGHLDYLVAIRSACPTIPLLRKDFVIHPYQVWQTRAAGADALLLIVAALSSEELELLLQETLAAKLDALIEVHTEQELEVALSVVKKFGSEAESRTALGINNRDLNVFKTDLQTTERIIAFAKKNGLITASTVFVAESGISSGADLLELTRYGASAFLVGESLVASGNPGTNLAQLIKDGSSPA